MSTENPEAQPAIAPSPPPNPAQSSRAETLAPSRSGRAILWRLVAILAVVVLLVVIWRSLASHGDSSAAVAPQLACVPVAPVIREDLYNQVTIPAEFRPYAEVDLHAKVSGYVREIKVDFGDRVKAGQLLATLEVPELDDELQSALAAQRRAEADYTNAHLIYDRLSSVNKEHPNLVALQELDTASSKDLTTAAAIAAAKADVARYKTMVDYTRITAPFDGVITKRYADPGALIQSGTSSDTQTLPLVRVSDNYRLRLDFPVSVSYVKDIHVGDQVGVRVDSLGDKTFSGIITRTMSKVNEDTRTMTTEIEVPNLNLELIPGMYAAVELKVQGHRQVLTIPTESIPAGQRASVYVVNDKDEIEERPVTLGLETPTRYEVVDGLKEGDRVLVGSRSAVKVGQKVEVKAIGSLAQQ